MGQTDDAALLQHGKSLGYSEEEIRSVPEGVVCRGCGNPTALADLNVGETVLDLGAGQGLDAFLAARKVGQSGSVIGIDASAESVAMATRHAADGNYRNVVFKVGQMAALPVDDESVDVVISNCVINYSPEIAATFRQVFRCLKPGGRMVVADLVTAGEFPPEIYEDRLWGRWIAGAVGKLEYLAAIDKAGFSQIEVVTEKPFEMAEQDERLRGRIVSIQVRARKL